MSPGTPPSDHPARKNLPGGQDAVSPAASTLPAVEEMVLSHRTVGSIKDYAIFTMDLAGVVTSWNPGAERVFGHTASEITGQQGEVLWTPEDRARGAAAQERDTARRDGMAEDKRWHLRKDGSHFFANGTMRPLLDEAGTLRGFTKVCRDASAEKRDAGTSRSHH